MGDDMIVRYLEAYTYTSANIYIDNAILIRGNKYHSQKFTVATENCRFVLYFG